MKRVLLAIAALALIAAFYFVWHKTHEDDATATASRPAAAAAPSAATGSSGTPATVATDGTSRVAPVLAGEADASPRAKKGIGKWGMVNVLDIVPASYRLTPASGGVAINVNGEASSVFSPTPGFPGGPRMALSGRVVDRAGHGVEGAAVIVSTQLVMQFDSFLGEGGAITAADGSFTIADVPVQQEPLVAMAMHSQGWSKPTPIAANAPVTLAIASGSLTGTATYNGIGTSFDLRIDSKDKRFGAQFETRPDGTYDVAIIPAGEYVLTYSRVQVGDAAARHETRDFVIEDGKATRVDVTQRAGSTVNAIARVPTGVAIESITGTLFPGDDPPADAKAAKARARAENLQSILLGGVDAGTRIQFQDVMPGDYVVCMSVDPGLWGCTAFELHDRAKTTDVGVDLVKL